MSFHELPNNHNLKIAIFWCRNLYCFVKTTHDYDSDHGHRYDWNREDLYFNVTVFGIMMEIEALPYIEKGLLSLVP